MEVWKSLEDQVIIQIIKLLKKVLKNPGEWEVFLDANLKEQGVIKCLSNGSTFRTTSNTVKLCKDD